MGKIIEILHRVGNILFPPALFREWPFMLIFCMMSAPFPCYFLLRAIYLPSIWFPALRDVLIVLFFAWICARIIVLFKRRWIRNILRTLLYMAVFTEFMVFIVVYKIFNLGISPDLFIIIFQTNTHEASGFFQTFIKPYALLICALAVGLIVFVILLERFKTRLSGYIAARRCGRRVLHAWRYAMAFAIVAGAVLAVPVFKLFRSDYTELRHRNIAALTGEERSIYTDNLFTSAIFSACFMYKGMGEFRKWQDFQRTVSDSSQSEETVRDSLQVVFVLGESYIRSHSTFYGYRHETAPQQKQDAEAGNLIAFQDISTVAKSTERCLGNIFNLSSLSCGEDWEQAAFFPLVLKKSGMDVYYFDNNTIGRDIHNFMVHNIFTCDFIKKECFTQSNVSDTARFDAKMVEESFQTKRSAPTAFYIYHLNGQHVPFKGAVPEGWERFGVEDYRYRKEPWMDDERRQMIADYDNATLANDSVMGMIYNHFRDKNAVVVYVSDHGEEVYDYRDSMGRKNRTDNTMEQYIESFFMVPATVWMSPKFKELYPGKVDAIKKAASRRGSIDDIGHFILGLAEVSSPYYRPERDIASDSYKPVRRLTTEGFYIDPE